MPLQIFNFFMNTLREKEPGFDTITQGFDLNADLSFKKLQSLIQIYNRCPVSTKGFTNNSNQFWNAVAMQGYKDDIGEETPSTVNEVNHNERNVYNIDSFKHFTIKDNNRS